MERGFKMEFLKEILGEKYDEFVELLGDVKLKIDDGQPSIPKARFDDVNTKYKDLLAKYEAMKQKGMTEEEKLQEILDQANQAKSTYNQELAKMKAILEFEKAGISEDRYTDLLDKIVTDDVEETVNLTKSMVNVITDTKSELEKSIRKELLDNIPDPPLGDPKNVSVGESFAETMNKQDQTTPDFNPWA